MKKMKAKRSFKKWFYNKILNRYLIEFHPLFIQYADDLSIKTDNFSVAEKRAAKEYKRIMKILNSQKYKKYFYNAVNYTQTQGAGAYKPFNETVFDKIKRFVAKQYLRLFNKKLYRSLQLFKVTGEKFKEIDSQINEYMKNTTVGERIERAIKIGIVRKGNYDNNNNEYADRTNEIYQYHLSKV